MSLTNYEFRSCSRRPLCACHSGFGPTTTVAATRLVQRWCGFITIQGAKQRSKRSVSTSDKHEGCSGSGFCHATFGILARHLIQRSLLMKCSKGSSSRKWTTYLLVYQILQRWPNQEKFGMTFLVNHLSSIEEEEEEESKLPTCSNGNWISNFGQQQCGSTFLF